MSAQRLPGSHDGTTAGGPMTRRAPALCSFVVWALAGSATTAEVAPAEPHDRDLRELLQQERQTSAGGTAMRVAVPAAQIAELRRLSGLTWDQLARTFDLSRRALHYWASGRPSTPANEERLQRMLAVVRRIDRGSGVATREALLAAGGDGRIALDLLAAGEFDEVARRLGQRGSAARPVIPRISEAARQERRPPAPATLLDARHDTIHRDAGSSRPAKSARHRGR